MNTCVIALSVLIVAAGASPIRPNTGWGPPGNPQVELILDGALTSSGSGTAQANQQLTESGSGDTHIPATILSFNIVDSLVEDSAQTAQITAVNFAQGLSNTAQIVDSQQTVAAEDYVSAVIAGGAGAHFAASSGISTLAEGQLAIVDTTINNNNFDKPKPYHNA